jgi:hypothetical protein
MFFAENDMRQRMILERIPVPQEPDMPSVPARSRIACGERAE